MKLQINQNSLAGRRVRRLAAGSIAACFAIVLGFLLCPTSASANTVYVSQSGGMFSGGAACNGQNTISASAFNTSGNWTTGTPSGTQIGPGTLVWLCGSITAPSGGTALVWQGSGASGNPITVRFDTGAAIVSTYCNVAGNSSGCLVMSSIGNGRSYLVLDGGTPCGPANPNGCNGKITSSTNGTGLATQQSTNGIEAENCSPGCEVKNIGIYNQYTNISGDTAANPQAISCIWFSGSGFLLHDSTFHDSGWCMINSYLNGESNVQAYNMEMYHLAHGQVYSAGGNLASSNFQFHDNHIHDFNNWDAVSAGCPYHLTGFHAYGVGVGGNWPNPTNLYIYNNLWDGNAGVCATGNVFLEGNPPSGSYTPWTESGTAYFFNNISNGYVGIFNGNPSAVTNDLVANNTVLGGLSFGQMSTYTIKNNAFSTAATLFADQSVTNGVGNYNAYANCSGYNCLNAWGMDTANFLAYQANTFGQELQSVGNMSGTLGISSTYVPQNGSLVIKKGTNLGSMCSGILVALCKDHYGNARPTTGAWDIGAVISGITTAGPAAPSSLSVTGSN